MKILQFFEVAEDLELAGLIWQPEIGDEVSSHTTRSSVSVLIDPEGMGPEELRATYLWLPTFEQMVMQVEARQAILQHTGFEVSEHSLCYRTIIQAPVLGNIEAEAESVRLSLGMALKKFLLLHQPAALH